MKKRIGNDIQFTWHIYRKDGDTQVPESFTGKDVEVKLISPLQRPVTIENVSIATGVVTFTFRGKHQVTLGNYVAVLLENRGEDGMVTLDVVNAVTLVPHSYMEEDGDEGDVIEAEAVELTSTISAGGGGTPIDAYTKAETDALLEGKYDKEDGVRIENNEIIVEKEVGSPQWEITEVYPAMIDFYDMFQGRSRYGSIWFNGGYMCLLDEHRYSSTGKIIATLDEVQQRYLKPDAGIPATDLASDVQNDLAAIDGIRAVIPEQASSSNQLVDKDCMNSSIATATATFRGAFNLVTDLHLSVSATHAQIATALATTVQTADSNDYCYVQIPVADATPTEFASVERYKYNGSAWEYEYTLNNSGFTAAQWAALNSGITSGLVAKLSDLPTATELATLLAGKASTQELAGKQDKMLIVQVASGTTAINAAVNTYYEVAGEVGTLAITLPTPTDLTKVAMVVVHFTAGTTPNVVIGSTETIDYSAAYDISASKEYEINCLFNGGKWVVADMEVV